LLGRATAVAFEVERLEQSGIATLTPSDPAYPRHLRDRLGTRAPPVLHAAGAVGLLGDPGLGLVGCGATAPPELRVALEGLGLPLVHCEGHGPDGVCLVAEPLVRTLRRPEIRRAIYRGSTVVCTPYGPDTPFSSARATGLQPLIHGLSRVTLVVSCEPGTGDAWLGAIAALDGGYGKVAVWRGAGAGAGDHAGNERLEARGAVGVASTGDLEALLRSPGGSLPTGSP
ncbi:MAG: hypothetical protein QOG43_1564, partial [Actinomycetota bacterium]|nr:hypothetical protein [Actinomycetota bacterium]